MVGPVDDSLIGSKKNSPGVAESSRSSTGNTWSPRWGTCLWNWPERYRALVDDLIFSATSWTIFIGRPTILLRGVNHRPLQLWHLEGHHDGQVHGHTQGGEYTSLLQPLLQYPAHYCHKRVSWHNLFSHPLLYIIFLQKMDLKSIQYLHVRLYAALNNFVSIRFEIFTFYK